MKSQDKTKTINRVKSSAKIKASLPKVFVAHDKNSKLRHFRLVEHKHTGRLIHHRHTSHLSLAAILAIIGLLFYTNNGIVNAETATGSVSVGVVVTGPPPTVGAEITSHAENAVLIDAKTIDLQGVCAANTFVVVKDIDSIVGSTMCTDEGTFAITVQVHMGANVFSVMNYDNYNQPGPISPGITIIVKNADKIIPEISPVYPVLPDNPSIIPGVPLEPTTCNDYKVGYLPVSDEPHVSVVCVPRIFGPGISQVMGLLTWGGTPPYAVSINWGDDLIDDTLLSVATNGYRTVPFRYTVSGVYKISLKLTDSVGEEAVVQTAVQVSGAVASPVSNTVEEIISKTGLIAPVPVYLLAVSVTAGFWIGDIFNSKFGIKKNKVLSKEK
jgi:hypothetical protein